MKKLFRLLRQLVPAFIILSCLDASAQQLVVHTASKANNSCNGDCTLLDIPELNNNPNAIIWANKVIENGVDLNPHPLGAYYFKNQWSLMNLDQQAIAAGAKFKVEYILGADADHFQYTITEESIRRDGSALIDHPALNNHPKAQFQCFLSWNPGSQRGATNREETTVQYNTEEGKWSVRNINKKPLFPRVVYNIAVFSQGVAATPPVASNAVQINELIVTPAPASVSGPIKQMYMSAWANGVKISGDNMFAGFLDKTQVFGFAIGATQTAGASKRSYESITLKIHSGVPATTQFFNAFIKSQGIVMNLETYSSNQGGKFEINYTIKLTGARITGFRQVYEELGLNIGTSESKKFYDELTITFTQIEFLKDGVSMIDNP